MKAANAADVTEAADSARAQKHFSPEPMVELTALYPRSPSWI